MDAKHQHHGVERKEQNESYDTKNAEGEASHTVGSHIVRGIEVKWNLWELTVVQLWKEVISSKYNKINVLL